MIVMSFDRRLFLTGSVALALTGCHKRNAGDMVVDGKTDRMYGMRSDGSIFTDPTLYPNRRLKLSLRNMSGDAVWDLDNTREQLTRGYLDKGYERSDGVDFGLKLDLNVIRSQQYDSDVTAQFAFLGAVAGTAAGATAGAARGDLGAMGTGAAVGMAAGATLGTLASYFTADHIYVVITEATFALRRNAAKAKRVVTFDGSPRVEEWEESGYGSFVKVHRVLLANYGGGRSVSQQDIAEDIRQRQIRSLISLI